MQSFKTHEEAVNEVIRMSYTGNTKSSLTVLTTAVMAHDMKSHIIYEREVMTTERVIMVQKTDEPSIVKSNGFTYHFLNGKLHREDGPARYNEETGAEFWYLNGERHREDGPAVTEVDGSTQWWLNGHLHREDGPAIEITKNGRKVWFINGEFQRAIDKDNNELNQYMQKVVSE